MKTRLGFVSNSSSTSFCLYGVYFDDQKRKKVNLSNDCNLYTLRNEIKCEVYAQPYADNEFYAGISWATVKDNETGAQFKDRVYQTFKKKFPELEKSDLETLENSWYDG